MQILSSRPLPSIKALGVTALLMHVWNTPLRHWKLPVWSYFFNVFFFEQDQLLWSPKSTRNQFPHEMRCFHPIRLTTTRFKLKTFHSAALRRTCQTAVYFVLFSLYWVNVIQVRYSYKHFRRRIGKRLVLCSRTLFIKWIHTRIIQYTYLLSKYTWHLPGFPFNEDLSELHIFLSSRKLLRWFQIRWCRWCLM